MTPQQAIDRYRHIVVSNSDRVAHELDHAFRQMSESEQAACFGTDPVSGPFWLYRHPKFQGYVLEIVYSEEHGDCISSLYRDCTELASVGEVIRTRANLVHALSARVGLSAHLIAIADEGRGREVQPKELGTGQLIDMLAEQMGASVMTTDNRSGNEGLMKKLLGR